MKNTTDLFERIQKEDVDYFSLESFLNRRLPIEKCKITVPYLDPNKLPFWREYGSIDTISTEAGYVYELSSTVFENEKFPTIESILKFAEEEHLFIPRYDLAIYLKDSSSDSGVIPYISGNEIKFFKKYEHYGQSIPHFYTDIEPCHINSNLKKLDVRIIFSRKEVIPNSTEIKLIEDLNNLTNDIKSLSRPSFGDDFSPNELLKLIRGYAKPYDLVQGILSDSQKLISFIDGETEKISRWVEQFKRYSYSSISSNSTNNDRH